MLLKIPKDIWDLYATQFKNSGEILTVMYEGGNVLAIVSGDLTIRTRSRRRAEEMARRVEVYAGEVGIIRRTHVKFSQKRSARYLLHLEEETLNIIKRIAEGRGKGIVDVLNEAVLYFIINGNTDEYIREVTKEGVRRAPAIT